jgi:hypothetical protein
VTAAHTAQRHRGQHDEHHAVDVIDVRADTLMAPTSLSLETSAAIEDACRSTAG